MTEAFLVFRDFNIKAFKEFWIESWSSSDVLHMLDEGLFMKLYINMLSIPLQIKFSNGGASLCRN